MTASRSQVAPTRSERAERRLPAHLSGPADLIHAVGGALLTFIAVVVLLLLAVIVLDDLERSARGEAFVAVVGAISTLVGGYVGVKIGASGKQEAVDKRDKAEEAKDAAKNDVAVLLGKLRPEDAAETAHNELRSV